ncbi:MAG TPA: YhjD/YihY/BrkB family envelope integrity protein [Verrucomicrobiae bacterium]|nr:YhjD/YihY/BrkB family envelope integrity protein [Verrucomicrobiae bacterium]
MATKKNSRFQSLRSTVKALWDESFFRSHGEPTRLYRFIHFWVLVAKSFSRNRCPVRASALAYATLLALIPILAVVVSISSALLKGESEERIDQFIESFVASVTPPAMVTNRVHVAENSFASTNNSEAQISPDETNEANSILIQTNASQIAIGSGATNNSAMTTTNAAATGNAALAALAHDEKTVAARKVISRRIKGFIQTTRSGTLGVTGTVVLIFVAISMLSRIENTFNDIWGVECGRGWFTRVTLYWTILALAPVLLIVALGLTTSAHLVRVKEFVAQTPVFGGFIFHLLPVILLCFFLALFYKVMTNTKVRWGAAFIGGLAAGILWHLNNVASVFYVSRVITNSKIYGGLAMVPVFMVGLYFLWLILLFGAQVAYAFQNRAAYLQEKLTETVNQRGREFIALRLLTCVGQRFQRGMPPANIDEISAELGVPSRLAQQVLQTLVAAHLVLELSGEERAYAPARPLEHITAHHVLMAMRATQGQELMTRDEPVRAEVYGEFARIQQAEKEVASSVTMLALVNRAQASVAIAPPLEEKELKLKSAFAPPSTESPVVEAGDESKSVSTEPSENHATEIHPAESSAPHPTPINEPSTDEDRDFPL